MTTVYLLTTGDYSDYTVVGIFSEEKLALDAAARFDRDEADVKPFDLDEFDASDRWLQYTCVLGPDGNPEWARENWRPPSYLRSARRRYSGHGFGGHEGFAGHSDVSHKDAYRLASEARQEWLRRKALGKLPEQQPIDDPPGEWKCKD